MATKTALDRPSNSKAGIFVAMRLVSINMAQPIEESFRCFKYSKNQASLDVKKRIRILIRDYLISEDVVQNSYSFQLDN